MITVALVALAAAAGVVGVTLLQTRGESTAVPGAVTKARNGPPLLQLEFGTRSTPETQHLARAVALLDKDREAARAAAIFRRYHSPEAQLGLAFATWQGPSGLEAVRIGV